MAKCSICGKSILFGNKVSHSHKRANKVFRPNIKRVRIQTEKRNKRVYVCTSCLRSGAVKRAGVSKKVSEPVVADSLAADIVSEPSVVTDSIVANTVSQPGVVSDSVAANTVSQAERQDAE